MSFCAEKRRLPSVFVWTTVQFIGFESVFVSVGKGVLILNKIIKKHFGALFVVWENGTFPEGKSEKIGTQTEGKDIYAFV